MQKEWISGVIVFEAILVAYLGVNMLVQDKIFTLDYFYHMLENRLSSERIGEYWMMHRKGIRVAYILLPLLLFFKILMISLLIQLPLLLRFYMVPLAIIFRGTAMAESASVLENLYMASGWFFAVKINHYVQPLDTQSLSILDILDFEGFSASYLNLLAEINLFECIWCIIVILYLKTKIRPALSTVQSAWMVIGTWVFIFLLKFILMIVTDWLTT